MVFGGVVAGTTFVTGAGFVLRTTGAGDDAGVVLAGIVGKAVIESRGSITVDAFAAGIVIARRAESPSAAAVSFWPGRTPHTTRAARATAANRTYLVFTGRPPRDEHHERRE